MPCYDTQSRDDEIQKQIQLNRVTDMLCRVGRALWAQGRGAPLRLDSEVIQWFEEHKKADSERGQPW